MRLKTRRVNTFAELEVGDMIIYSHEKSIKNFTEWEWDFKVNPKMITKIFGYSNKEAFDYYNTSCHKNSVYLEKHFPNQVFVELDENGTLCLTNPNDILICEEDNSEYLTSVDTEKLGIIEAKV